jgi:hypothetical protein
MPPSRNATPRTADDSYTAALLNGIPQSLLYGMNSTTVQTQGGSTVPMGALLSGLSAAINTAAQDGSGDTNWVDDLVSFASGLGDGTGSASNPGSASSPGSANGVPVAGGALASDLNSIGGVIRQLTAQVSSALVAQGASASQISAAVQALTTSLTLNSLGAVAQQIAAQTGGKNTITITSSVVTVSANGSSASVSKSGETDTISGGNTSLALSANSGSASLAGAVASDSGGTGALSSQSAQGFGYTFSIADNGPAGSVFAGTSDASATAEAVSVSGSGVSTTAAATLDQSTTIYESAANGTSTALVLLSDWEAGLESTAAQQTAGAKSAQNAQPASPSTTTAASTTQGSASESAPPTPPSLADSLNAAAHALFKHALALLEALFGRRDSNSAGNAAQGNQVDVYV